MHDPAYKLLFSHPRMVEDLLRGFIPRPVAESLDFSSLEKLPCEFVTDDLRRRVSDSLWRVRLRDRGWLYLVLMLEFQSTVDPWMAVRILTYTGLLHEDLIRRGALSAQGKLPPVLPVVFYNGERRWGAAREVGELIARVGGALRGHQPSQRHIVVDAGSYGTEDLPEGNLASAVVRLETSRSRGEVARVLRGLERWLDSPQSEGLKRVLGEWVRSVLLPRRVREAGPGEAETSLSEVGTMLEERVKEWTAEWVEEGRRKGLEQGLERGLERGILQGIAREAELLRRQATRKFDAPTAERLSAMLEGVDDPEELARVGEWIIECGTGAELLGRVGKRST